MDKKIEVIVFCLFMLSALAVYVLAASDFNCTIVTNTSCTGTGNISVLYIENGTGYYNSHAQNTSVAAVNRYDYSLCCGSTQDTISLACADTIFLILSNETNAHIQQPSINTYSSPICMSAATGTVSCSYSSSCSSGKACVGSMASSESTDANQTNAHIGPCSEYAMKICCGLNSPPSITTLILNSTFGTNRTTENLTAYATGSDGDGDSVRLIYNWYRNNISLAVLNMPFEGGSSNSTWTKDYSPYGNNGSVSGAAHNSTGGWNLTGAYELDGTDDFINVSLNQVSPITIALWVKFNQTTNKSIIAYTAGNPTTTWSNQLRTKDDKAEAYLNDGSAKNATGTTTLQTGVWYHIAMTASNDNYLRLYVNGAQESSISVGTLWSFGNTYLIGSNSSNSKGYFNGIIDEVLIFNRSLSAEQIRALFNNRTDRIVAEETTKNEIWRVDATPNDGAQDGAMKSSNNLTILNSPPTVTLNTPEDNNLTTDRTPTFSWIGADNDTDSLTYTLNLTCYVTTGGTCADDDQDISAGSSTSYTLTKDLRYLTDNNKYYNWTVRAYDSTDYSSWATPRRIDIKSIVDVTMVNDTVNFGEINISQGRSKNTTTNDPFPLLIRNTGTVFANVSINATKLWESESVSSANYRFKIDNKTTEPGAFNWLYSLIDWTNMPPTTTMAIVELNYSDDRDEAEIDLLVNVPTLEGPGNKSSIINFTAYLGE